MLNDPLANVMSVILNNEEIGRSECIIKPSSKVIKEMLKVMKTYGYLADFKEIDDSRGNYLKLSLNGSINKCGVIKPRYSVRSNNIEKFENRYLPAKDLGLLFMSTPKGIMAHYEAKAKKLGGRLLAYCY